MTSLEKKVRSFLDGHEITLTEQQMNLLLLLCPGVARNVFSNAADFAYHVPPLAALREHAGELYDELVRSSAAQDEERGGDAEMYQQ